jgi:putative PIN family toxin of toxin-antitoxin system
MKVILDTNVVIAAFATQGLCHLVVENVIAHHELVSSEFLLHELTENLTRKIKIPRARANEIAVFLKSHAMLGKDTLIPNLKCRDQDDLQVLSLAVHTQAEVIVTGDQDLLVLGSVSTTAIVSPRDFWNMLRASE